MSLFGCAGLILKEKEYRKPKLSSALPPYSVFFSLFLLETLEEWLILDISCPHFQSLSTPVVELPERPSVCWTWACRGCKKPSSLICSLSLSLRVHSILPRTPISPPLATQPYSFLLPLCLDYSVPAPTPPPRAIPPCWWHPSFCSEDSHDPVIYLLCESDSQALVRMQGKCEQVPPFWIRGN